MIIETSIAIPLTPGKGRPNKYSWDLMSVGNSSFFSVNGYASLQALRGALNCSIKNYVKDSGKQFISRKEGDGIRVWRIK